MEMSKKIKGTGNNVRDEKDVGK